MKTKLVIFGITGDLASRKLLPALSKIIGAGEFDELSIIGVSRRHMEEYELLGSHHEQLNGTTTLFTMDLTQQGEYERLRDYIDLKDDEQAIFYLSVPPTSSAQIVELLGRVGLNTPNTKLLLEKPFGVDLASARELIAHIGAHYSEDQVYRIDHYLAKEMAQNILSFRARNALFAHVWNGSAIERIDVLALESIDIEGRAHFFEQTGALRDVLQGHLMQLLSLVLLDVPAGLDWSQLPAARLKALQQVRPVDPQNSVRGQYAGYRDEVENNDSMTETFVSIRLESDDPRWKGVPLALTTGKALDRKATEVRIHFRKLEDTQSNYLIFRIQPREGIEIDLVTKRPGYDREYDRQRMRFNYATDTALPDAYEQVLVDAIRSHKSLFAEGDEVLRAWELITPLQEHWRARPETLRIYDKGSSPKSILA